MKKLVAIMIMAVLCVLILAGCNSVPKEECVEDPFELVTVDIYDREYKVSGNFNSSKELCSTLASFKIEDIKKSVADYGYFFGKTEDCEHYILLIPYVR